MTDEEWMAKRIEDGRKADVRLLNQQQIRQLTECIASWSDYARKMGAHNPANNEVVVVGKGGWTP